MITSEATDKISEALAKAQGMMKNPEKNKTAKIPMKAGGTYSFDYADLPSTFDTNRKVLSENGLSHSFGTKIAERDIICSCRLSHSSGQWYESELILPASGDIKGMAGNLTYLKRYLFQGLVGITGDDDTDGDPEDPKATYTPRERKPAPAKTVSQSPSPIVPKPAHAPASGPVSGGFSESTPTRISAASPATLSPRQAKVVEGMAKNGWKNSEVLELINIRFQKKTVSDLEEEEFKKLLNLLSIQTGETALITARAMAASKMGDPIL